MAENDEHDSAADPSRPGGERPAPGTEAVKDPHTSPANPENRIELERMAADREAMADIVRHPLTPPADQAAEGPPLNQPPASARGRARKQVRTRAGQEVVEVQSTGHSWDGIEEYDNPLPRWWLWTFYATCVWAFFYTIAYPAWPLVSGATQGVLGTSNRAQVAAEIERFNAANGPIEERLTQVALTEIAADPELANYTQNAGSAIFRTWCAQCHGSGAAGARGYPNLLDNDWLWGGTIEDIHTTLLHGIRSPEDPDTRYSEMPRFGRDELLDDTQITQVANYVLSLSDQPHDAAAAAEGGVVFAEQCTACHLEDGSGDRMQGAPDLTDAVWLYGGDLESLTRIIHEGPFGVMPAWSTRLSEAEVRAVAAYVHGLGGGE